MKTIKFFTLAAVVLLITATVGQSKENEIARKKALTQLNFDIKELFDDMPFDELMKLNEESELSLCFNVMDDGTVQFYHILGKNSGLVEYSKEILEESGLNLEKYLFNEDMYWIKVKFKYIN